MTFTPDRCHTTGKIAYATRAGAHVAAARMNKRKPKNGIKAGPCDVYRCPFCHHYHAGHHSSTKGARK